MIELFFTATLSAILLTLISGPLGSFVIWKRMSYFGDTLAHSALLGVALGLWLNIDNSIAVVTYCLITAALLSYFNAKNHIAIDTLLGILSHGSLAIGLVMLSLSNNIFFDLNSLLFGDLLAVNDDDIAIIATVIAIVSAVLIFNWQALLSATIQPELARVEGVNVARMDLLLMLCLALVVAFGMQIVGVLLISALLIIPPATARQFATSPEQMAGISIVVGSLSVLLGMVLSVKADTPAGPSIVAMATVLFLLSQLCHSRR